MFSEFLIAYRIKIVSPKILWLSLCLPPYSCPVVFFFLPSVLAFPSLLRAICCFTPPCFAASISSSGMPLSSPTPEAACQLPDASEERPGLSIASLGNIWFARSRNSKLNWFKQGRDLIGSHNWEIQVEARLDPLIQRNHPRPSFYLSFFSVTFCPAAVVSVLRLMPLLSC